MSSVEDTELKGGHPPAGKYLFYVVIGTNFKVNSEQWICSRFFGVDKLKLFYPQ